MPPSEGHRSINDLGIEDSYLGDGVYASFDGFSVTLDLRAQPSTSPITQITLEPSTMKALFAYCTRITEARKQQTPQEDPTDGKEAQIPRQ